MEKGMEKDVDGNGSGERDGAWIVVIFLILHFEWWRKGGFNDANTG